MLLEADFLFMVINSPFPIILSFDNWHTIFALNYSTADKLSVEKRKLTSQSAYYNLAEVL